MPSIDPAVAILPYGQSVGPHLAQMSAEALHWPLGMPERLQGKRLSQLTAEDHLIIYPKTSAHVRLRFGTAAKVSMMVVEPEAIHAKHLTMLRYSYRRFFRVLSYNDALLARIPNGVFVPYGTTWVPDWRGLDTTKTKMVSLIASNKRSQTGHILRHKIVDYIAEKNLDVDVLGRGYKPFEAKSDGLAPYRYSVVIENIREPNYFSEKLIDAVLCDCVPIYWGCPNLDRFLDTKGMIICTSAADITAALQTLSAQDYATRLPALQAVKEGAAGYADLEKRAAQTLLDSL
jgi:hypothetical protein